MTSYPVGNEEFLMVPGQFSKEDISETLYTKFQPCTPKCMFLRIWTSTLILTESEVYKLADYHTLY